MEDGTSVQRAAPLPSLVSRVHSGRQSWAGGAGLLFVYSLLRLEMRALVHSPTDIYLAPTVFQALPIGGWAEP